ncbi:MAG: hypothetical protein ACOYEK_09650, partial [bacterium]
FAAGFLQILRRRRHPCLKLTATATFTARDFHPRDSAHAGRTEMRGRLAAAPFCCQQLRGFP